MTVLIGGCKVGVKRDSLIFDCFAIAMQRRRASLLLQSIFVVRRCSYLNISIVSGCVQVH